MTECAQAAAARATTRLDASVTNYRQRLSEEQRALFDASQVAWESFRSSACLCQASLVEAGSAHAMVSAQCVESLTNERLRALEEMAGCEEGDLSCPAPDQILEHTREE